MIRIDTKGYNKEEVLQSFLLEFTKMILCGMSVPRQNETVEQAMALLSGEMEIADTYTGFTVGNEDPDNDLDVQDCAFSIAMDMFGKNSYSDEFGSEQACITYVAEQLLGQYPELEIEAQLFLDTNWSNTAEIVSTVDGRIVTEIEER